VPSRLCARRLAGHRSAPDRFLGFGSLSRDRNSPPTSARRSHCTVRCWREWIRTIGFPSELNIRTEPGGGEARIQLTAGNRMHWQKGGFELRSPLESIPLRNCFGTSRVDRAANGPCRSCSSGYGTEVGLFLENRTTAAANVRTGFDCLARPQADQAASSRVHSASLVQPWRIMYWASSADISMVPSGLTLMCRPEKVCTDPIPEGACRRTRYRSGFSGF
jgi:hypothetical protein